MGTEAENAAQSTTPTETASESVPNAAGEQAGGQNESPSWLPERLKRAEAKAAQAERERLLKELGIEDPAADKELLAAARKRREDEMSAVEKAAKDKEKAEQEALTYKEQLEQERSARLLERRDNALENALRNAGVSDDKDNPRLTRVLTLLKIERKDEVDGLQAEDGTIDAKKLSALVETAGKVYPEYFKPQRNGSGIGNALPTGRTGDPKEKNAALASLMNINRIRG